MGNRQFSKVPKAGRCAACKAPSASASGSVISPGSGCPALPSLLQEHLLAPILGIGDARTDKRIDFVGGVRGVVDLEQRVREGRAAIAFAPHPTRMEQLTAVADAGKPMPPKSTWFEPKLADGLLAHVLD
jgi:uncharacterized protein (DUF1015 family)